MAFSISSSLRVWVSLVGAALLAGCGAADDEEQLGTAVQPAVCAAGAVVKGIDISSWQGNIDWSLVKGSGLGFAIVRISDGDYLDPKFDQNWAGVKSVGMIRGAYQFFEPGEDPNMQADIVINAVGKLGDGDLPVTCDVEVSGNQSKATVASHLQTWLDKVATGTGKTPMIYTSPSLWSSLVGSTAFGNYPLWVANWGVDCPNMPSGWSNWAVWQYSATGSVSGISGDVDLDEFNGDLAALQQLAGGGPDWAAKYVDQSWPFADTTMQMTVNQSITAFLEEKNVGQHAWDSNTRLATTQPRDRPSPFVASDWLSDHRLAAVSGTVQPGESFKFTFTFHAPEQPGVYDEFFGLVQEGVAWFSDSGGPADNVIEAKIEVVEAQYHGTFLQQAFPTLQDPPLEMTVGQTLDGWIELKNVGTATWKAGETKLAPTPRDTPSPLAGADWESPTRVSTLAADVAPGKTGHFPLSLRATTLGDFTQTFGLIEEGVTWFADAPKGGGPPDNLLAVHVVVSEEPGGGGGGGAGGTGGTTGSVVPVGGETHGGCSCRTAGSDGIGGGAALAWLFAAGAVVAARRRHGRGR